MTSSIESDCPICYGSIDCDKNCITTECGHIFHATCLLKNTQFNGYGCPYCRTQLVEDNRIHSMNEHSQYDDLPSLISDSDSSHGDMDVVNDDEETFQLSDPVPIYARVYQEESVEDEEYILDGMRWLFQRANQEEVDEHTIFAEPFENWMNQLNEQRIRYNMEADARMNIVISELEKINAISYNDLVRGFLFTRSQYFSCSTVAHQYYNKVNSTLDSILNRFSIR